MSLPSVVTLRSPVAVNQALILRLAIGIYSRSLSNGASKRNRECGSRRHRSDGLCTYSDRRRRTAYIRSVSYMVVFYGIKDFMSPRFSPVITASLSMEAPTAAPAFSILPKKFYLRFSRSAQTPEISERARRPGRARAAGPQTRSDDACPQATPRKETLSIVRSDPSIARRRGLSLPPTTAPARTQAEKAQGWANARTLRSNHRDIEKRHPKSPAPNRVGNCPKPAGRH